MPDMRTTPDFPPIVTSTLIATPRTTPIPIQASTPMEWCSPSRRVDKDDGDAKKRRVHSSRGEETTSRQNEEAGGAIKRRVNSSRGDEEKRSRKIRPSSNPSSLPSRGEEEKQLKKMKKHAERIRITTSHSSPNPSPHNTNVINLCYDSKAVGSQDLILASTNYAEKPLMLQDILLKPAVRSTSTVTQTPTAHPASHPNVCIPSENSIVVKAHEKHFRQYLKNMWSTCLVAKLDHYSKILPTIFEDIQIHTEFLQHLRIVENVSCRSTRGFSDYAKLRKSVEDNLKMLNGMYAYIHKTSKQF